MQFRVYQHKCNSNTSNLNLIMGTINWLCSHTQASWVRSLLPPTWSVKIALCDKILRLCVQLRARGRLETSPPKLTYLWKVWVGKFTPTFKQEKVLHNGESKYLSRKGVNVIGYLIGYTPLFRHHYMFRYLLLYFPVPYPNPNPNSSVWITRGDFGT